MKYLIKRGYHYYDEENDVTYYDPRRATSFETIEDAEIALDKYLKKKKTEFKSDFKILEYEKELKKMAKTTIKSIYKLYKNDKIETEDEIKFKIAFKLGFSVFAIWLGVITWILYM